MDRGAWWPTVHRVTQSRADWSDLACVHMYMCAVGIYIDRGACVCVYLECKGFAQPQGSADLYDGGGRRGWKGFNWVFSCVTYLNMLSQKWKMLVLNLGDVYKGWLLVSVFFFFLFVNSLFLCVYETFHIFEQKKDQVIACNTAMCWSMP